MTELVFLRRLQVNVNPKYPYVRQSLISLSVFVPVAGVSGICAQPLNLAGMALDSDHAPLLQDSPILKFDRHE
ncbi:MULTISPECIES: hypothetical protein [Polaromonas]|uniref:Uncharacterized protein n=1 Tax=Polaromonas aquatica TaxID=332657 RepID=A0ABW1U2Y7_9BURK